MSFPIVEILGVPVASLTMGEAVEQAERWMDERHGALIATANAEMIMNATRDEELISWCRTVRGRFGLRIISAMKCRNALPGMT